MVSSNKNTCAENMLEYINNSPSPFHAVKNLKEKLDEKGAVELDLNSQWNLENDRLYYFIKDGMLAAFRFNKQLYETGFHIAAAHTDSPGFRIKPVSSYITNGYERLNVEGYGGSIWHTWLDRPLGIAGIVYVKDKEQAKPVLINTDEPVLVIPSLAIHMNRDINENAKFNLQTELCPFFSQNKEDNSFKKYIASIAGCDYEDILSFELMPYDVLPGCFTGANKEFISSPRLDDLNMVYSIFTGLLNTSGSNAIALAFDHEECGSKSDRGADSILLMMLLDRVLEKLNYTEEMKYITLSKSFLISGDMAHSAHPSYSDKNDPHMIVYLNKGPVLKTNYNQSYASNAKADAYIKILCKENDIPLQEYTNRSDIRGGGTIGPMLSSQYGVTAVDIGNPMLSMHSVRELCGTEDSYYMVRLFEAYYM